MEHLSRGTEVAGGSKAGLTRRSPMPVDTLGQRLLLHYRRALQVFLHLLLWAVSLAGAFLLRFEFSLPDEYLPTLYVWLIALIVARGASFYGFGMFSGMWRYTGAKDLVALVKAT